MTRAHPPQRAFTSRLLTGAALALLLASLAACASPAVDTQAAMAPHLDTEQWENKVTVEAHPDEILLAPHAEGLSDNQDHAVDALLHRWLDAEAREIVVSAPVGAPGSDAAGRMAVAVRLRLMALGASGAAVRIIGYDSGGQPAAPLKVGFLRHVASIPKCGETWDNLTATKDNGPYANFGCAVAANMAAQVANPEDLIRPRDTTPIDAGRRDTVLSKYRKGETTASAKEDQANGAVSKAIN